MLSGFEKPETIIYNKGIQIMNLKFRPKNTGTTITLIAHIYWVLTMCFTWITQWSLPKACEIDIILIYFVGEEVMGLVPSHSANRWLSQHSDSGSVSPRCECFTRRRVPPCSGCCSTRTCNVQDWDTHFPSWGEYNQSYTTNPVASWCGSIREYKRPTPYPNSWIHDVQLQRSIRAKELSKGGLRSVVIITL